MAIMINYDIQRKKHLYLNFSFRDHNGTKILTDVIEDLSMSVIGGPTTYDPQEYDRRRQELVKYVPASQDELPHRRMSDSFDSALIPLGSDKRIRDRYATHLGGVRIGTYNVI